MAKWEPKGAGLLAKHPNIESLNGEKVLFYEAPFDSDDHKFWNVKIRLEDRTKWLASLGDRSGDNLRSGWGEEMNDWVGRYAKINVSYSDVKQKYVYTFEPTTDTDPELYKPMSEEQRAQLRADIDAAKARETAGAIPDTVNADDIPF